MKKLHVGCCGFPVARYKYYKSFNIVELQNTFYELPGIEWARKIREEAPRGFEFTVKAWQVISHPYTSPTWRRMKKKPEGNLENYGYLKPTRENIMAFEKILEIARVLEARIIVLQTPSSMPGDDETLKETGIFFEQIKSYTRRGEIIGWEARGKILENPEFYKVLAKYDIIQVVDLFRARNPYKGSINLLYTRLHGIGPGEVNYNYNYTNEDLEKLHEMLIEEDYSEAYVLFNNVRMYDNALRFKEIVSRKGILSLGS